MGIPVLNMVSSLATSVMAGDMSPDMLKAIQSGKLPPGMASGVAGAHGGLAGGLAAGLSHMSGVALFGGILFGGIGSVVMVYGKKKMNMKTIAIGAVMFGYPFLVYSTAMTYGIGIGLCLLLYFTREKANSYTH